MPHAWQQLDHGYGTIHIARGDGGAESRPDILIVFIHGICSNAASWKDTPDRCIDALGTDVNVLNFQYPAGFFARASLDLAAQDLLAAIRGRFSTIDHLFFVCHSAGGLVAKQAILQLWGEIGGINLQDDRPLIDSLLFRIRNIFNIAVPHGGGRPFASNAGCVLAGIAGALAQLKYYYDVVKGFAKGSRRNDAPIPGWNQIIMGLRHGNPTLAALERRYLEVLLQLDEHGYPRPVALDYMAASDEVVPHYRTAEEVNLTEVTSEALYRADAAFLNLRGTHTSVRHDIINTHIFGKIRKYFEINRRSPRALQTTRQTIAKGALDWCRHLDGEKRIRGLFDDVDSLLRRNERGQFVGCQRAICAKLYVDIMSGAMSAKMAALTGASGTGKSAVLRSLVRRFANRWRYQNSHDGPIALGVPMQEFRLTDSERVVVANGSTLELQRVFLSWVAEWGNRLLEELPKFARNRGDVQVAGGRDRLSVESLSALLTEGPLVLVLDSIDEFMGNNALGDEEARNLIGAIREVTKSNQQFTVVVGARAGSAATRMALDLGASCYEVATMSAMAAQKLYRGYEKLLEQAENDEARTFLLTPQILARLGPLAVSEALTRLNRPRISELAFDSFLSPDDSQCVARFGIETCKDALAVLAWLAMVDPRSSSSESAAGVASAHSPTFDAAGRSDVTDLLVRIGPLPDLLQHLRADRWPHDKAWIEPHVVPGRIGRCFDLLKSRDDLVALLHNSVFVSVGIDTFRFDHQEWLDYAAARYLALALTAGNMQELGWRTFSPAIFQHLGWQLRGRMLTESMMSAILDETKRTGNQFIIGNFAASLGYWRPEFERDTILDLLTDFARASPPRMEHARHVLLTSLGLLALQPTEAYASAGLILAKLRPAYLALLRQPGTLNSVTLSLVWCYSRAFDLPSDVGRTQVEWPRLDLSKRCLDDGVFLSEASDEHGRPDKVRARSLQYGYAETARSMLRDQTRVIGAIHYFYLVAAAIGCGRSFADARLSLIEFMAEPNASGVLKSSADLAAVLRGEPADTSAKTFCAALLPEPGQQLAVVLAESSGLVMQNARPGGRVGGASIA